MGNTLSSVASSLSLSILLIPPIEAMVEHRARALSALLPIALATGYSETEPDPEPLKVLSLVNLSRREFLIKHLES